jgi:hypothetical protein
VGLRGSTSLLKAEGDVVRREVEGGRDEEV